MQSEKAMEFSIPRMECILIFEKYNRTSNSFSAEYIVSSGSQQDGRRKGVHKRQLPAATRCPSSIRRHLWSKAIVGGELEKHCFCFRRENSFSSLKGYFRPTHRTLINAGRKVITRPISVARETFRQILLPLFSPHVSFLLRFLFFRGFDWGKSWKGNSFCFVNVIWMI